MRSNRWYSQAGSVLRGRARLDGMGREPAASVQRREDPARAARFGIDPVDLKICLN